MKQLKGIFPALITPFTNDNKIDEKALRAVINWNLEKGVSGFYVGGSTGEAFLLSMEERKYALEIVVDEIKDKAIVISHIGSLATHHAIELAQHAAKVGADILSSVPPFFYKYSAEEITSYYIDIVNEVSLPMVIYNVPVFTGIGFTNEEFDNLLTLPSILGVKHTSNDLFQMERLISQNPDKNIISGYDEVFLGALAMGAKSAIGSTFNFMAENFISIQNFYEQGKVEEARIIQQEVNQIIDVLTKVGVFAGVKTAMEIVGIPCGNCRRPMRALNEEEKQLLKSVLKV